jgi:hypothetical protein
MINAQTPTNGKVPPKDRLFPKYARHYFDQLREQYELLLENTHGTISPTVANLDRKIAANPRATSWADVFALETAYLYAIPPERLAAEVLLARDRYCEVAGDDVSASLQKSLIADLETAKEPALRAELLTLAERVRYVYTFVPPKELSRNKLAMRAAWSTLAVALIGIAFYVYCSLHHIVLPSVVAVLFMGQLGGFLSVQQRLQASKPIVDPLLKELQLSAGWFSVAVIAPISGAVFSLVLYFLFVAGLLSGGFFPSFGPDAHASASLPTNDVIQFLTNAVPTRLEDWGKMLAWAFIAGFAERFVPDVLTRLTGSGLSAADKKQPASPPPPPQQQQQQQPR